MIKTLRDVSFKALYGVLMILALFASSNANAGKLTLDFEGLQDFEYASDFYNGGFGGSGSSLEHNSGVSFSNGTVSYLNNGPSGAQFGGQLTPKTALSFQQFGAWMNVQYGFTDTLSFYYANPNRDSVISIYSGINGQGQLITSLFLPQTPYEGVDGSIFPMQFTSVNFYGVAKSIDFDSMAHRGYIDDLSIISSSVPESKTYLSLMLGLGLIGLFGRRNKPICN